MNIKFSYTDPLQLSETLQEYGQAIRITQLENGEGSYSMAHTKSSCMAIARSVHQNHFYMKDGAQVGQSILTGLHQCVKQIILLDIAKVLI